MIGIVAGDQRIQRACRDRLSQVPVELHQALEYHPIPRRHLRRPRLHVVTREPLRLTGLQRLSRRPVGQTRACYVKHEIALVFREIDGRAVLSFRQKLDDVVLMKLHHVRRAPYRFGRLAIPDGQQNMTVSREVCSQLSILQVTGPPPGRHRLLSVARHEGQLHNFSQPQHLVELD